MIYEYKCTVCQTEFEIECPMSEHKPTVNCGHCYTQDGAKQLFRPETAPSVKIWDNPILKHISFD